MSLHPGDVPSQESADGYIRGSGGVHIDGRRIARYLVAALVLILAALTVIFTLIGVHHNSRATSLKSSLPVEVTVTGCVALASGTGITEAGFNCKGSYTLGGHHYTEPIGGSAELLAVGQKVAGVTVRNEPAVLYSAASVAKMHSTWTVYLTPAALLLVLVGAEWFRRRLRTA